MCCPPETARLFFALVPDAGVRRRIAEIQRCMDLPGRRVPPSNLHVTLAFLGDVDVARIDELLAIGGAVSCPPCRLTLDRQGWFPRAAVTWLGSGQAPPQLLDFRERLAAQLAQVGFGVDTRPWTPHLTLYRKMRKRFATIDFEPVEWRVDGFSLVRSTLTGTGAVYDPLGHWQAVF